MYYPVEVAGGLLSMGDCHGSQSDGETAATGIETSLNGKFRYQYWPEDFGVWR